MDVVSHIPWDSLLPFLIACIVIESTPGPNMAFLTVVSATKGRKFGFATVLGITLGLLIIGFAAAAGLATVISNSQLLYQGLRIGGILYLLWLAYEEWQDADGSLGEETGQTQGRLSYFQHGLIVNILNPKAGVFYVTILPSFIDPNEAILPQAIILTLISVGIATLAHILIVSLAGLLKPLVVDHANRKRFVRRVLSVVLVIIASWFGLST